MDVDIIRMCLKAGDSIMNCDMDKSNVNVSIQNNLGGIVLITLPDKGRNPEATLLGWCPLEPAQMRQFRTTRVVLTIPDGRVET